MNINIHSQNTNHFTNIVKCPNSFDSDLTWDKDPISWLLSGMVGYCQNWIGSDYQICLQRANGQVVSTGVSKTLMDRYCISDVSLSIQEIELIKYFLVNIFGDYLLEASEMQLKALAQLLSLTENLNFVKVASPLKLNNFDSIVNILIQNHKFLQLLTSWEIEKVEALLIALDSNGELLKSKLINKIVNSKNVKILLVDIVRYPKVLTISFELLDRLLDLEHNYNFLSYFGCYPELLNIDAKLLNIILLKNNSHLLGSFGQYPQLLEIEFAFLNKLLEYNNVCLLDAFGKYPRLAVLHPTFLEQILSHKKASGLFMAIAKNLELMKLWENHDLIQEILAYKKAPRLLSAIAKNLEIVKLWENRNLIQKILSHEDAAYILKVIAKNLQILELCQQDPNLIKEILLHEIGFQILKAISKNLEILKIWKEKRDLIDALFVDDRNGYFLKAMSKDKDFQIEILKLWDGNRDLLKQIFSSSHPQEIINSICKNEKLKIKILNIWNLKPDLIQVIFSYIKVEQILKAIDTDNNWNILILWNQKPDLLKKAFGWYSRSLQVIFDSIDTSNTSQLILAVAKHPQIWELNPKYWDILFESTILLKHSKSLKTIDRQLWETILNAQNPLFAFEIECFDKYLLFPSVGYSQGENELKVFINRHMFLNNKNINEWNVLMQTPNYIDKQAWELLLTCLADICDALGRDSTDRNNIFKCFMLCMETSDATETISGRQLIKKRIYAIIYFLSQNYQELKNFQTSEPRKAELKTIIQGALDKIANGGHACPDAALVYLREVENHLKLFAHPKYVANIFVNMFKFHAITIKLIDRNQAENIETFLKYTLLLNNVLGLGVSGTMLYEEIAKTFPIERALPILCTAFTEKALIDFTANQSQFQLLLEQEKKTVLAQKNTEYIQAVAEHTEVVFGEIPGTLQEQEAASKKIDQVAAEIKQMEDSFFIAKARKLFLDSGFLVENKS